MSFLLILGRQPELGLVELESVLGADELQPWGDTAALTDRDLDINQLGGTQKIGRVIYRGPNRNLNETPISLDELPVSEGKTTFGLSLYGVRATQKFALATGLTLKKRLRSRGSVRFVSPQEGVTLSAAQVKFNGLLRNGFELLVAVNGQEMVVAVTQQVQDIDSYAARDYQRPSRSAKVGMLPPKLTQIMINTTTAHLVVDPFCGTGVVLQEALLLGRQTIGSDLSEEMVAATRTNLEWLANTRPDLPLWAVELADAQQVTLPPPPLAIVSEGYLGQNLTSSPTPPQLKQLITELQALYEACLRHWATQLPADSEVTITAPVWRLAANRWQPLPIIDRLPDLGYTLKQFAHANSGALVYRRPQQIVGRQLLILRKS